MKKYLNILWALVLCALLPAASCTKAIPWDDGERKPVIKGETKTVAVPWPAGETVLNVEQTEGFDVRISEDAAGWLSASGSGSSVTVSYAENPGLGRSGQVILTKEDVMWIFTVNQDLNPTSGPHDIDLLFVERGRVYGMIIYGIEAADLSRIPVGDKVVFDMTNNQGSLIIYDGSTNATILEQAPVSGKIVVEWTEELKNAALGFRMSTEENPIVKIHYTNIDDNLPREIEVPFSLLGEMGGMVIYGFEAGAFADVEPGMDVIFEFETSEGGLSVLTSANVPFAAAPIENGKATISWTEDMAGAAAGGGRIILAEGNGNHLVRIHAADGGTPDGPKVFEIACPDPRPGMPIQIYAFDAGAFDAVPAGYELVFELENSQGDFNILDATGGPVVGVAELTESVFKVIWTEEYAGKVAGGARVVMSSADNFVKRIYAHEVEEKVVTVSFAEPMAYNGWNIYQFPEGAFAEVEEGMTVTFTCESEAGGYNFLSAANAPVTAGEFTDGPSFSVTWTSEMAESLAGGGRLVLTDESNHLTKIEAR